MQSVNHSKLKSTKNISESGFFDKVKRAFSQITTETEGWIVGFI